ncbi:ABC transporter ATP-binding protein [Xylanibacillus composti]|uniref:ABC transporter ATP-binding protein n=1 Tax=Xylanibacillus composti TaxID=1572762 RepID=A0A8J4H2B6_9BACL|nr:AAA family ATPase [Xylanibacillus composti]GIQ69658.1 ABC transporter ATP-binding protein [Xylanibacillus composti]
MFLRSVELLKDKIQSTERYPFHIPAIRTLDRLAFSRNVTFFVGENGSGKSTLLEAIAYQCGFNPAGGGRNNVYEVESADAALGDYLRLSWLPKMTNGFFLRAESFYQFATHIDQVDAQQFYGGRSLHEQSHGESFLSLFLNRFNRKGIFLLDEPEAALSPTRQLSFLRVLKDLEGAAQFIIATHSPIILGYPNAQILQFDHGGIREVNYEQTEHYQITRRFLENRNVILSELFEDE